MSARPLRILLIDDDEDSPVLIQGLMSQVEEMAFHVEWMSTYEMGLAALRGDQHDVCLLDYRLGARDGLELLREAVALGSSVPIILLTGQNDHGIDMQALKAGAADYLAKGVLNSAILERTLRYAIERFQINNERLRNMAHLRMLTEQLPAVLWTTDCQMRFTSLLGAGLFGPRHRPGEVIGKTLFEYFQTEDHAHPVIAATRQALGGHSTAFETDWQGRTYRGQVDLLRQGEGSAAGRAASTIGVALDITDHRQVEEEFRVARKIQQGLLPARAPILPGLDIAGVCHPAAATGGDYFDYLSLPDGSLGIVVGDVSNHGFGPTIIMAGTRRLLRTLVEKLYDVREILTIANRAIVEDTRAEDFVTLFFAHLDPQTRSLVYAGAGHEGYVLDEAGVVHKLQSTGLPLGIDLDSAIELGPCRILQPGEMLVLLTDGFPDAMSPDGHPFGNRRVFEIVHSQRGRPAQEILDYLYQAIRNFCQPHSHHDDATAVIVKVESSR